MKMYIKRMLILMLILIVLFFIWVYVSFAGLPWQKFVVGKQVHAYIEEKYNQEFNIIDRVYNFKDGSYGIRVTPINKPDMEFSAWEGYGNYEFIDYFPEAVWEKQVYDDFKDIVNETYPDYIKYQSGTVMGVGTEIVKGAEIPNYKEVDVLVWIKITTKGSFTQNNAEYEKMLAIISQVKKADANIEVSFSYQRTTEQKEEVIFFEPEKIKKINSVDDIKRLGRVNVWSTN